MQPTDENHKQETRMEDERKALLFWEAVRRERKRGDDRQRKREKERDMEGKRER